MAAGIGNIRKEQLALVLATAANDPVILSQMTAALAGFLSDTDVIDNLTSTDTDKPLSASQGKVLKDLIDSLHDEAGVCEETHLAATDNATFTLANTPDAGTLKVYLNGIRIAVTSGYTISGAVVTIVGGSKAGDCLLVDYKVEPTP